MSTTNKSEWEEVEEALADLHMLGAVQPAAALSRGKLAGLPAGLLADLAVVGTVDIKVVGVPVLGDIELLHEKEIRVPLAGLLGGLGNAKLASGAQAKLNLGGLGGLVKIIEAIKALIELLKGGGAGSGGGTSGGSGGGAGSGSGPVTDRDPYPDGIKLVGAEASHPNHPDGTCTIDEDNVIHPPASWGTTSFDDGTHFVLSLGYLLGGKDLAFPEGSKLDRSSRLLFTNHGRARAILSATELDGGGFMADGGQIRNRYDVTRGMDPTVKFKAGKDGGPADGDTPMLEVQAPTNDAGSTISEVYAFAPFQ